VLGLRVVVGGPVRLRDAVRLGGRTTNCVAGLKLVAVRPVRHARRGAEVTCGCGPRPAGTPRTVVGAFPDLVCSGSGAQITRAD